MFIANAEFIAYRLLRHAVMGLALTLCMPIVVQYASAQQQIRYPQLLEHEGKEFAAYVNEKSRLPYWVIDIDSLDFTLGTAMYLSTESGVENAADAFIEAHAEAFGMTLGQLGEPRITGDDEWWFVSYPQLHGGNRVLDADYGLTVTRGGKLIAAGATGFSSVSVTAPRSLSSSAAIAAAKSHAGVTDVKSEVKSDPIVVPVELDDSYSFRLAWEVTLYNYDTSPPFSKTYIVDANNGTILREYSNFMEHGGLPAHAAAWHGPNDHLHMLLGALPQKAKMPFAVSGAAKEDTAPPLNSCSTESGATHSISGTIRLNYYESPNASRVPLVRKTDQPFKGARFRVRQIGGSINCTGHADENGQYSVSLDNDGTYEVTFDIANDIVPATDSNFVDGLSNCQRSKSFTLRVDGAARLDYNWDWGDSGDGGLTSFALNGVYQIRRMYEYFTETHMHDAGLNGGKRDLLVKEAKTGLFSSRIELGGPLAMSSDIALHEYTHGVLFQTNGLAAYGDSMQAAMHEGFSDYFTTDATNDHIFGGPDTGNGDPSPTMGNSSATIRLLYNWCTMDQFNIEEFPCGKLPRSYPRNRRWHRTGNIISGAIWRIRSVISAEASSLLYKALEMSPSIETFEDLRVRFEAADNAENSGVNAALIEDRFVDRKIDGPIMPILQPVQEDANQNALLSWTDRSSLEDGYVVESRSESGQWSVVSRLESNATGYTDTNSACDGTKPILRYYRVAAYKAFPFPNESYVYDHDADTLRTYSIERQFSSDTCSGIASGKTAQDPVYQEVQSDSTIVLGDLLEVYPTPFNPEATVRFAVKEETHVHIVVYDMLGRQVATLVNEVRSYGNHSVRLDGHNLPSGAYIIWLSMAGQQRSLMVHLIK